MLLRRRPYTARTAESLFIRVTAENGEVIAQYPREHMAPGEMEEIKLTKEQLAGFDGLENITVKIEEA